MMGCANLFGAEDEPEDDGAGNGGTPTVQNLPERFSVDAPESIRSSSGASASSISIASTPADTSYAYQQLTSQVQWMEAEAQSVALEFIIADRLIGDAFELGTAQSGSFTVEITQTMVDQIIALFSESPWWDEAGEELETEFNELVGQQFPISFDYDPITSDRYDHKLITTYENEEGADATDLRWDAERKNISLIYDWGFDTETGTVVYTYNDDTKTANVVQTYESESFGSDYVEITLREATDETLREKNGVFVRFTSRSQFSGETWRYNTQGYADDDGGRIAIEYSDGGFRGSEEFTFDASGNETSAEYSFEDDDFTDMSGAAVLEDVGVDASGYFQVEVTGVVAGNYYVVATNGDLTIESEIADVEAALRGDGDGVAADTLEVMLWQEVTAGTTLHVYSVTLDESGNLTSTDVVGTFSNP